MVPKEFRATQLAEAHEGHFAGHLSERKIYDRLRRYVWWRGLRNDVISFCKSCLVGATRKGGRKLGKVAVNLESGRKTFRPPLTQIPVGGLFHRVAVDILQLPLTANENHYVAVFMDYLTKYSRRK